MAGDHDAEALARFDDAVARRDAIKELWESHGAPLLSEGSKGQLVEHPLMKMMREHDLLVQKLRVDIKKTHRGPQPSAVFKPSPALKLRSKER